MKSPLKINPKFVNKSEIARNTGLSGDYVRKLLRGDRSNQKALNTIYREIQKQLKAA